jgi:hypothetical protein
VSTTTCTSQPGRVEDTRDSVDPESTRQHWFVSLGRVYGLWAFLVIVVGAILAGFADPDYGWNLKSLRLLITFVTVFALLNYGGALAKWAFAQRSERGRRPRVSARPVYLILIVVTMLFARATDVAPALVFGSVLALDYGLQEGSVRSAISTFAGALYAALLGVAALIGYSFLVVNPITDMIRWAEIDPNQSFALFEAVSFGTVALGEFFSILCIAAIATLPLALLPFAFLDGANLWRWNKFAWGLTYAAGTTLYSLVLVPLPASWEEINRSFGSWVAIYALYAFFAIVVWAVFQMTKQDSGTRQFSPTSSVDTAEEMPAAPTRPTSG